MGIQPRHQPAAPPDQPLTHDGAAPYPEVIDRPPIVLQLQASRLRVQAVGDVGDRGTLVIAVDDVAVEVHTNGHLDVAARGLGELAREALAFAQRLRDLRTPQQGDWLGRPEGNDR